jgi:two-component system, chemotaxis family, chemotaxis protein CheY
MKTLIAEDDLTSRLILQEFLKNYGTSHVVVTGKEAVDAACLAMDIGEPYDLICLDIMMPEMDGQQALKEIRALEEARGILSSRGARIIMITTLNDVKNVNAAFMSLCDAYVTKPLQKAKILDELRKLKLVE